MTGTEQRPTAGRSLRAAVAALVLLSSINLLLYWSVWGGDPEIHLVFARNLLAGHPLQFNAGVFSSGETSPAYMVLVAGYIAVAGTAGAAVAMKFTGLLSALFIARQLYLHARFHELDRWTAGLIALSFLAVPSTTFQACLGMENILFAAVVVWLLRQLLESRLAPTGLGEWLGLVLGLVMLFYLRPETAFVLLALAWTAIKTRERGLGLAALASAVLIALSLLTLHAWTGVPLQAAGAARAAIGRVGALRVQAIGHTVYLQPKLLGTGLWFLPFALALGLGGRTREVSQQQRSVLISLVALPMVLHGINVLPTLHLSRYLLYALASLYLAGCNVFSSVSRTRLGALFFVSGVMAFSIGNASRYRNLGFPRASAFQNAMASTTPERVRQLSDRVCSALGCAGSRAVLALAEVQLRLRLDERFVVWSLDGSVDAALAKFVRPWGIDHFGYLKYRGIDYLLELPNYNIDSSAPSLSELDRLRPGQACIADGMRFDSLASKAVRGVIRVTQPRVNAAGPNQAEACSQ